MKPPPPRPRLSLASSSSRAPWWQVHGVRFPALDAAGAPRILYHCAARLHLLELAIGACLAASLIRGPEALDDDWVEATTHLIVEGVRRR